jgi:hypothetical protein
MQILTAFLAAISLVGTIIGIINWHNSYSGTNRRKYGRLVTIIGIIGFLTLLFVSIPPKLGGYTVVGTPTSAPTSDTPTPPPTPSPTPTPTAIPTPTPTPSPTPTPFHCEAGTNQWQGWSLPPNGDWQLLNGALINNGSRGESNYGFSLTPPPSCQPPVADYAVEATVQSLNSDCPNFLIFVRGTSTANGLQGYAMGVGHLLVYGSCGVQIRTVGGSAYSEIAQASPPPISGTSVFRAEVKGFTLKFFIDGNSILTVNDTTNLSPGQIGLYAGSQLEIIHFKVVVL